MEVIEFYSTLEKVFDYVKLWPLPRLISEKSILAPYILGSRQGILYFGTCICLSASSISS